MEGKTPPTSWYVGHGGMWWVTSQEVSPVIFTAHHTHSPAAT